MNELQASRDGIKKDVDQKMQEGREMKQQLNKMKKSIGYSNEADIDDRIATIEFKMWTDSLTLKEEKKYLDELKELKRNRPKVSQVHKMEEGLNSLDTGASLKEKVTDINAQMFKY